NSLFFNPVPTDGRRGLHSSAAFGGFIHQPPHAPARDHSFITQTLNRVEARSLACGPDAEDEADEDRDDESGDDRPERYRRRQHGEEEGDDLADADGEDDADDAAEEC